MKVLGKLLGRGGRSPDLAAAVRAVFAPLDTREAGIVARIERRVFGGGDPTLEMEVVALRSVRATGLRSPLYDRTKVVALAALADAFEPDALQRLGLLLEIVTSFSASPGLGNGSWPLAFFRHDVNATAFPAALRYSVFEAAYAASGTPTNALVRIAMCEHASWDSHVRRALRSIDGYGDAVVRHAATIRDLFTSGDIDRRAQAYAGLAVAGQAAVATFAPDVAAALSGSSKRLRQAAQPCLRIAAASIVPVLREIAATGPSQRRFEAVRALAAVEDDADVESFLRERAAIDDARLVRDYLTQRFDRGVGDEIASDESPLPHVRSASDFPATPETRAVIERAAAALATAPSVYRHSGGATLDERQVVDAVAYIEGRATDVETPRFWWMMSSNALAELFASPACSDRHVMRSLYAFGAFRNRSDRHTLAFAQQVAPIDAFHAARGLDLDALMPLFEDVGIYELAVARLPLLGNAMDAWPASDIWPFYTRRPHCLRWLLDTAIGSGDANLGAAAIRLLGRFPHLQGEAVVELFALALGSQKTNRAEARAALAAFPNRDERIVAALGDAKADVRANAAAWLADVGALAAVPALHAAVRKEKNDVALSRMLATLERFGEPIDAYVGRDRLAHDAKAGLAKGIPAELEAFARGTMPVVRYADTNEPVDPQILTWLLVSAYRLKTSAPTTPLLRHAAGFVPADRAAFGDWVFGMWLAEDTRTVARETAEGSARRDAQRTYGYHQRGYLKESPLFGKSEDEIFAALLPTALRALAGSASGSRGVLAVAAACASEAVVAPAARYLEEYFGTRVSQGKALIEMLAWLDDPGATQVVLAIANRFRTKSLQDEAIRQIAALAERRGWTVAELADRTVPTAGFDATGTMELSYGNRAFAARLGEDFSIALADEAGKRVTSLPAPRKDDDADLAKEAKATLSNAKKTIKSVVALQTERFYESLCIGRTWRFENWNRYLNGHPIAKRLCARLVWIVLDDAGDTIASFRPIDDGSLTDPHDETVRVADDATVAIGHDTNLDAAAIAAWISHMADYEVAPLFVQFGRAAYRPSHASASAFDEIEGHILEAFALRNRATRLGWQRGSAGDGGWFTTYEKRYPTLGIAAVVEFTGSPLPEENRTVSLRSLSFERIPTPSYDAPKVALAEIPPVLLSESVGDVRAMAAEGPGFDAEWEKKSQW